MSTRTRRPKPKKNAPLSPEQQYRRMVPALLKGERDAAPLAASYVEKVANLARALADAVTGLTAAREQVQTLADALTDASPDHPYELPPSALQIAHVDPDGLLWAAATSGDASAVAETLGKLAAATLAREGAPRGR